MRNEYEKINYIKNKTQNMMFLPVDIEAGLFVFLKNHANYNEFETILKSQKVYLDYEACFNSWINDEYDTSEYKKWFKNLEESIVNIEILYDYWCEKSKDNCVEFINQFIVAYNKIAESLELDYIIDSAEVLTSEGS